MSVAVEVGPPRQTAGIDYLLVFEVAPLDHRGILFEREHVVAQCGREDEFQLVFARTEQLRDIVDVAAVPYRTGLYAVDVEFRNAVFHAEFHVRAFAGTDVERRAVDDLTGEGFETLLLAQVEQAVGFEFGDGAVVVVERDVRRDLRAVRRPWRSRRP